MRLRMQRTIDTKNEETAVCVPTKYVPCRPKRKSSDLVHLQGIKKVCRGRGNMLNKASYLNNLYKSDVEGIDY